MALRKQVRADFIEHFQGENLPGEPGGFALHFWPCWFEADGNARFCRSRGNEAQTPSPKKSQSLLTSAPTETISAGFDGIIGNPPWEGFKPFRKEFAANFYRGKPQFSKMGMDGPAFDKWFEEELNKNKDFAARWQKYEAGYEQHSDFFGRRFKYQGGGDYNLFKLFIEGDLALIRNGGRLSLLVPSGCCKFPLASTAYRKGRRQLIVLPMQTRAGISVCNPLPSGQ